MKKEKAPVTGREDCSAGACNSTATRTANIINSASPADKPKPKGRGKSQATIELIDAMASILDEIQPATVRAVCYQLFVAGHISDMSKRNTSKVSRHLVDARERGIIPWRYVVDEHRQPERIPSWDNPDELLCDAVSQYRKNYWQDQPEWVEVWTEKGTVRGTLATVLNKYGVTLRVMHGYGSATVIQEVAAETRRSDKPLTILYVGDWDPSGMNMSEVDIPGRIDRYGGEATIDRLAVSAADTVELDLPSFGAASKSQDTRHAWFVHNYGARCWELDALPPPMLRSRVANEIAGHLNVALWDHAVAMEAAEIDSMRHFFNTWLGTKSRPVSEYFHGEGER